MSKKYNVAVIGTGEMGRQHIKGWQQTGHQVISVADVNTVLARNAAEKFGVEKVYADYKEAIADPAVEIVSICLPLIFHAPVTIFAAEQRKHVFCEKPLTNSIENAQAMEAAIQKAGVQFGIGFQRNLAGDIALMRKYVEEGVFGRPLFFNSESLAAIRRKIAMHDARGNMGPVMDVCCHTFMMWRTVFQSRAKTAFARGHIFAKGRPELAQLKELAIDTASLIVEYESGDIGTMTVSWGMHSQTKIQRHPIRIFGPKGGMEAAGGNQLNLYQGDRTETLEYASENLLEKQFILFTQALDEGRPAPVGLPQGKEILALTVALFESMSTGQAVPISYDF